MISIQNYITIFEHLPLMATEPLVLLRLALEWLQQVLERYWPLHKPLLTLRRQECHTPELHRLVRSILVHKGHT